MKDHCENLVTGNNSFAGGFAALFIIALVALGCTCNKGFDLSNLSSGSSNNSTDTPTNSKPSTSDEPISTTDGAPSTSVVEGLVKETLSEFARAVDTKDFSDIYESASTDFKSTYTLDEMSRFFKSYTDKRSVVLPILKKIPATNADFSRDPSVRSEKGLKILMAAGEFKTKPYKVRFDFEYVMRDGEWKLLKLVINVP